MYLKGMERKYLCYFGGTSVKGSLDRMLDILNNIRLAMLLEKTKTRGRIKASYNLEEMDDEEKKLMDALKLTDFHTKRPKIKGVGVYTQ